MECLSKVLLSWYLKSLWPAYQVTESFLSVDSQGWEGLKAAQFREIKQALMWGAEFSHHMLRICFLLRSPCFHESMACHRQLIIKLLLFLNWTSLCCSYCRRKSLYSIGFLQFQQLLELFRFVHIHYCSWNSTYTQYYHKNFLWS